MTVSVELAAARAVLGLLALLAVPSASWAGTLDLPFTLTMPAGKGPFPAVVILHDCSGLGPKSSGGPWRWATQLTAGLRHDLARQLQTRGHAGGVCTDASPPYFVRAARRRAPTPRWRICGRFPSMRGGSPS